MAEGKRQEMEMTGQEAISSTGVWIDQLALEVTRVKER